MHNYLIPHLIEIDVLASTDQIGLSKVETSGKFEEANALKFISKTDLSAHSGGQCGFCGRHINGAP